VLIELATRNAKSAMLHTDVAHIWSLTYRASTRDSVLTRTRMPSVVFFRPVFGLQ